MSTECVCVRSGGILNAKLSGIDFVARLMQVNRQCRRLTATYRRRSSSYPCFLSIPSDDHHFSFKVYCLFSVALISCFILHIRSSVLLLQSYVDVIHASEVSVEIQFNANVQRIRCIHCARVCFVWSIFNGLIRSHRLNMQLLMVIACCRMQNLYVPINTNMVNRHSEWNT